MNDTILAVVHQQDSDTGRIGQRLRRRGYYVEVRCPLHGDALPERPGDHAGVLVFGGPMSANDTHLDGIRAELDWLERVAVAGTPYLGVCLGAQLMARALGAEVAPHPEQQVEIGYYPIRATDAGRDLFPEELHVYHWHKEGFDLPSGAELLASGERFPHQAYRYDGRVYGIQFHPEVTRPIMARWLDNGAEQLASPGARPADAHFHGHARHDPALDDWLERFLDHWLTGQR